MIPYAQLTPGPNFQASRAALYYGQRMVIWPKARKAIAWTLAAATNWSQGYPGIIRSERFKTLEKNGLAMLPNLLTQDEVTEIRTWLDTQPKIGNAYSLETVFACPYVLRVIGDLTVSNLVRSYLGCRPTLSSIGIRWSMPNTNANDVQMFHRDPDDWRFCKVFVYLTDVTETTGPHRYVQTSHRTAGRFRAKPYRMDDLQRQYGSDALKTITGPAGTSFIADTYGIHQGAVPITGPRLILQMQYSICENFALSYDAKPLHGGIDPYLGRLFIQ